MTKVPKNIWVILDDLDGPHVFETKRAAAYRLNKWRKEAVESNYIQDPYWDMIGPVKYTLNEEK